MIAIRDIAAHDFKQVIALNESEVLQTSPMDEDHLRSLVTLSSVHRVATVDEVVVAFLIAIASDAPYQNDNYRWFSERFSNFLYVDRVVVRADFSGRGVGGRLYADMFDLAQSQGIEVITCEYSIDPPNPASRAFHSRFGFAEVGSHWVSKHSKKVSLQALNMQAAQHHPAYGSAES
ncbi:GNAT family N-acetyltransferase [Congregibacter variabilis]|uniref:GNAT family N-acetyltransferase n=1 Tax=Congregibacter variabilis TaxID=3081200 RepID=A0ABZ0HZT8_9GAMM|nr:GNAT family N-acetyltransferase [Congregibacter sp. IMCC43200]